MPHIKFQVSESEHSAMAQAAELEALPLASWLRRVGRQAAEAQLVARKLSVPFLPAPPAPPAKPRKPLPPGHFYEDELPERPALSKPVSYKPADTWPTREAWLNSKCISIGLRFPDDGSPLAGKRCYALLVEDMLDDDAKAHAALEHDYSEMYRLGFPTLEAYWEGMLNAEYPKFREAP